MSSIASCTCSKRVCATKFGPLHEPVFLAHASLLALYIAQLQAVWVFVTHQGGKCDLLASLSRTDRGCSVHMDAWPACLETHACRSNLVSAMLALVYDRF